jgi:hypothetical protein
MNIVANTEPRIRYIKITSNTITAFLMTAGLSVYRWHGLGGFLKRLPRSVRSGELSGTVREFIGQTLMKTSALKACSTECQLTVRAP